MGAGRPPICGSGRWRRESRRSGPVGTGPLRRAWWRGAVVPGVAPDSPRRPHAPHPSAPGHWGAPVLGVEEALSLPRPECHIGVARSSGRGSSRLHGGVGHRPLRGRAGPGGVSQVDRAGRAARLGQGSADPAWVPTPPSGPRCRRGSARRALTLRHGRRAEAPRRIAPPPPSSRTSFSSSQRRWASTPGGAGSLADADPGLADPAA